MMLLSSCIQGGQKGGTIDSVPNKGIGKEYCTKGQKHTYKVFHLNGNPVSLKCVCGVLDCSYR